MGCLSPPLKKPIHISRNHIFFNSASDDVKMLLIISDHFLMLILMKLEIKLNLINFFKTCEVRFHQMSEFTEMSKEHTITTDKVYFPI